MVATLELDDIQGLVARGYGTLRAAVFVLLRIDDPAAARAWLGALAGEVATAERGGRSEAVHVALPILGCDASASPSVPGRLPGRVHGRDDHRPSSPHPRRHRREREQWRWGGPANPVDAVLLLYAEDQAGLQTLADRHAGSAASGRPGRGAAPRHLAPGRTEPFGFRDGISQPLIAELEPPGQPDPPAHRACR